MNQGPINTASHVDTILISWVSPLPSRPPLCPTSDRTLVLSYASWQDVSLFDCRGRTLIKRIGPFVGQTFSRKERAGQCPLMQVWISDSLSEARSDRTVSRKFALKLTWRWIQDMNRRTGAIGPWSGSWWSLSSRDLKRSVGALFYPTPFLDGLSPLFHLLYPIIFCDLQKTKRRNQARSCLRDFWSFLITTCVGTGGNVP